VLNLEEAVFYNRKILEIIFQQSQNGEKVTIKFIQKSLTKSKQGYFSYDFLNKKMNDLEAWGLIEKKKFGLEQHFLVCQETTRFLKEVKAFESAENNSH
jgi:hypothetical protein